MSDKMYYKALDWEDCSTVVNRDSTRKEFLKKIASDEDYRKNDIGIKDDDHLKKFIKNYKARGKCPGKWIKERGSHNKKTGERKFQMCTMYRLGKVLDRQENVFTIQTDEGKKKTFKGGKAKEALLYDKSHDGPADDLPDDIVDVRAFNEAALLKIMKRRFLEKLTIFTYVGDVILVLNPYMYLPKMIAVQNPLKEFKLKEEPNVYASAHFAYWGQRNPDKYPSQRDRNQSCIVSGESGSGKTVACGNIMKYLAELSNTRKKDLADEDSDGATKKDITKLVGGVSPFLEMFGNAKTNMNDNSSRFGKFTKIWFNDGMITGASLEHYLLEKARICSQGKGERNFHSFYFVVRGATAEEKKEFHLKDCDSYPKLVEGGSSLIGGDHGPEEDVRRMNAPLHKDPDETGARAALKSAGVDDATQHELWKAVAAVLNMSLIKFKSKGEDESAISNASHAAKVAKMLGLGDEFGAMLCVERLVLPKKGFLDKDCNPKKAGDNRNALSKDIYDKLFTWLIESVCNEVLDPEGGKEAFVGLLDIFGFEVMPRNSIEQLCINFANEKLQWMFNEHVFDDEEEMYKSEGLSTDVIPPHKDTTPCCHLVIGMGKKHAKKFTGILPLLDEKKRDKATDKNDCKYVQELCRLFGKKKKKDGKPFSKAKSAQMKKSSVYFFGNIKKDYIFTIRHYAGDITYDARGFIMKNVDKLPSQLTAMMKKSKNKFLSNLYNPKKTGKKKKSHKKYDTLAATYMDQLKRLADTLKKTSPHYVRCVKPNDLKFRPVDGVAAFDDWKSYRQLLYAGVMEVVEIKLAGFPFREEYDRFFSKCIKSGYVKLLGMDEEMDPKEGTIELARKVLPKPWQAKKQGTDEDITLHYWAEGNTLFFAKDGTQEFLAVWHQKQVSKVVQTWWRYALMRSRLIEFEKAAHAISSEYRVILTKRRFAKYTVPMIHAQAMIRSISSFKRYTLRKRQRVAAKTFMRAWNNFRAAQLWSEAHAEEVHRRATEKLMKLSASIVNAAKRKLAKIVIGKRLQTKLYNLRRLYRIQAHVRSIAIEDFHKRQAAYYRRLAASYVCCGHYMGAKGRMEFLSIQAALKVIQPFARTYIMGKLLKRKMAAAKIITRFSKAAVHRIRYLRRVYSTVLVEKAIRFAYLRESYYKEISAAIKIQEWWREFFKVELREEWTNKMIDAASRADLQALDRLMRREGRYYWIQDEHLMVLLNLRDAAANQSVVHAAVRSGSYDAVRLLLANGALPFWKDSAGETPLHISARYGDENLGITKLLLTGCPHRVKALNIVSKSGSTVLDSLFEENSVNLKSTFKSLMWLMNQGAESARGIDVVAEIKREVLRRQNAKRVQTEQAERLNVMRDRMLKTDALLQLTMKHLTNEEDPLTARSREHALNRAATTIQKMFRGWLVRSTPEVVRWRMNKLARAARQRMKNRRRSQSRETNPFESDTKVIIPPGLIANNRPIESLVPRKKGEAAFVDSTSAIDTVSSHDDVEIERFPKVARVQSRVRARLSQYREKLRRHKQERDNLRDLLKRMGGRLEEMKTRSANGENVASKVPSSLLDMLAVDEKVTSPSEEERRREAGPPGMSDDWGDQATRKSGVPTLWGPSSRSNIVRAIERPLTKRTNDRRGPSVKLTGIHRALLAAMQTLEAIHSEMISVDKKTKKNVFDWHYLDSAGSVHGPFRLGRIMRWYRQRRLRGDDCVRFGCGELDRFIPLSCVKQVADSIPRSDPKRMEHNYVTHSLEGATAEITKYLSSRKPALVADSLLPY
eukprot:g3153.t1